MTRPEDAEGGLEGRSVRRGRVLDLTDAGTVAGVTRRFGLALKRRLGQHFLVDGDARDRIVEALDPSGDDEVFEIGPGIGTLTMALAARARRVLSVDLDPACVAACGLTLRHLDNVRVLEADALRVDPVAEGLSPGYLAAGNIPYNLTGAILSHLLEAAAPPRRIVVLVQREVAARLAAEAGDWSLATVAVRSLATVERLGDLPPQSFEPPPAVHSSILRLVPATALEPEARRAVLDLARGAFQQRRKTLRHALTNAVGGDEARAREALARTGIDPARRPGTLDLEEWAALAGAVATGGTP